MTMTESGENPNQEESVSEKRSETDWLLNEERERLKHANQRLSVLISFINLYN